MSTTHHSLNEMFATQAVSSRWRTYLPLVGAAIVTLMFVLYAVMPMSVSNSAYDDTMQEALRALPVEKMTDGFVLRPFVWMSSALAVSFLFAIGLVVSVYIVRKEIKGERRNRIFYTIVGSVVVSGAAMAYFSFGHQTLIELPMGPLVSIWNSTYKPPITLGMDCLAFWHTFMLIVAICALSTPFGSEKDKLNTLLRRRRMTSYLLYLSGLTLTLSVIEVNHLFLLPGNATALGLTGVQHEVVAAGLTMLAGTYLTLLLTAAYIPLLFILQSEAKSIAVREGSVFTPEGIDRWLKENGVDSSWKEQLSRITALIGPFLAGWLGEPVLRALSL